MRSKLAAAFCWGVLLGGGFAVAQTCIVPRPASAPHAKVVVITTLGDGGTTGCTFTAACEGCKGVPTSYALGNAACAVVVQKGDLAASKDNGWDDGGVP